MGSRALTVVDVPSTRKRPFELQDLDANLPDSMDTLVRAVTNVTREDESEGPVDDIDPAHFDLLLSPFKREAASHATQSRVNLYNTTSCSIHVHRSVAPSLSHSRRLSSSRRKRARMAEEAGFENESRGSR